MPVRRVPIGVIVSIVCVFALIACTETQIPTQEPVEFHPTPADPAERSESTKGSVPAAAAPRDGDAGAGQGLFTSEGCSACHSTGENTVIGPGLAGIYDQAGTRTSLDASAYIQQSLKEPNAFIVDGFASPSLMPVFDQISQEEILDVIAYLKTLK